ncbi:MAG: DUF3168 domain-containing protein [Candidatus Paceibacterota bacterium]
MNNISSALYLTLQQGTALTALLAGTTSIYKDIAPDNASYPYVVFNLQGGGETNETPNRESNVIYYIRGYSKTSTANAGNIATQIDSLLHGKTLTITGRNNFWTAREGEIENTEILSNGDRVYNAGALYRVRC